MGRTVAPTGSIGTLQKNTQVENTLDDPIKLEGTFGTVDNSPKRTLIQPNESDPMQLNVNSVATIDQEYGIQPKFSPMR